MLKCQYQTKKNSYDFQKHVSFTRTICASRVNYVLIANNSVFGIGRHSFYGEFEPLLFENIVLSREFTKVQETGLSNILPH